MLSKSVNVELQWQLYDIIRLLRKNNTQEATDEAQGKSIMVNGNSTAKLFSKKD